MEFFEGVVILNTNTNQKVVSLCRQTFLSSGSIDSNIINFDIAESWKRASRFSVDPFSPTLPPPPPIEQTKSFLTDYIKYLKSSSYEYFESKHNLLSMNHAAIYYTDSNFNIFSRNGNPDLLKELGALNLRYGGNLSESTIGTNALALSDHTGQEAWVIGHEHYMSALSNYACVGLAVKQSDELIFASNKPAYFTMIVIPLAKFKPIHKTIFRYILNADYYFKKMRISSETRLKEQLLDISFGQNDHSYIMVNKGGLIVDCNTSLLGLFHADYTQIVAKPLATVFPELKSTLSCLNSNEKITLKEVSFNSLPQGRNELYIDCESVKCEDSCLGMIIIIYNNKKMQKIVNRVVDFSARFSFDNLIGESTKFRDTKTLAKKAANSPSNVLILGESGTGKELFAQSIHNASNRNRNRFISINCAAIPKELIGSELFGYADGAFTGARKGGSQGKFELANGGTLFLDEISEMPLDMQSVLLRVLEDRTVTRLGGTKQNQVDVRLIAATNQNLKELVAEGKFRLDLYYRLNVIKLEIIPLRERLDDIPLMVDKFLTHFSLSLNKNVTEISTEVMEVFQLYPWPGNVRELRNVIERCVNISNSNQITVEDLPSDLLTFSNSTTTSNNIIDTSSFSKLRKDYSENEKELIKELIEKYQGNKTLVAKEMGISRPALYRKLKNL